MIEDMTAQRIGANEAAACIEALADVLVDCVERQCLPARKAP